MSDLLRDKRVLLIAFIIIGMIFYMSYRVTEISTEIELTSGSIKFSIDQSGMIETDNILVYGVTDGDGNTYQEYKLRSGAELRPIEITQHEESIRTDAQLSFSVMYTFDADPLTNEAMYFKTDVSSSEITIEECTVFSASKQFIKIYKQEPVKSDSYSVFITYTELQGNVDGGIYLQYKGFIMDGLNREAVTLAVFIQIIEGS